MSRSYRIAVLPGDGIGKEVIPEGIKVIDAIPPHLISNGYTVDQSVNLGKRLIPDN